LKPLTLAEESSIERMPGSQIPKADTVGSILRFFEHVQQFRVGFATPLKVLPQKRLVY
jgi:hypothetical protein